MADGTMTVRWKPVELWQTNTEEGGDHGGRSSRVYFVWMY